MIQYYPKEIPKFNKSGKKCIIYLGGNFMLEIRRHPDIRSAVYITGFNMRVPADGSWLEITGYTKIQLEKLDCLKQSYEKDLIELRTDNYDEVPSWFFDAYRCNVKIPTTVLKGDVIEVLDRIKKLKETSHPIMWYILKSELFNIEFNNSARNIILKELMEEIL